MEQPKTTKTRCGLLAALLAAILCCIVTVIVLVTRNHNRDPTVVTKTCPPGFSGSECQNITVIGFYPWSGDKHYTLPDGHVYTRGMAFRVYAPYARSVFVLASTLGGSEQEYSML